MAARRRGRSSRGTTSAERRVAPDGWRLGEPAADPLRRRRRARSSVLGSDGDGRRRRAGDGRLDATRTRRGRAGARGQLVHPLRLVTRRPRDLGRRPRGSAFELRLPQPPRAARRRARPPCTPRRRGRVDPRCAPRCPARSSRSPSATGDSVVAGQVLLTIEAMKMEHRLVAPRTASSPSRSDRPTRWHSTTWSATITPATTRTKGPRHEPTTSPPSSSKLRDEVRDFADTVVAPAAYKYDTKRELPYEILAQMGEMGLFGLPFPEEYGGRAGDYFDLCLAVEQLAPRRPVHRGDARGRRRARRHADLPHRHRGAEAGVAADARRRARRSRRFGLTEADAGSDAGGTKTTARARRRRVGHQRHQAVHHQLRHRRSPGS